MRRISLALALVGAVAAAGCSGGAKRSSDAGGNPGVAEGTFTVTLQNTAPLDIKGGRVTSSPAGIDCGVGSAGVCSFAFPLNTTVVLTAVPDGALVDPAVNLPYAFFSWAGDCFGEAACTLTGNADKYVVVQFEGKRSAHPNFSDPAIHGPAVARPDLVCSQCHGGQLQGQGIAPSCTGCHTDAGFVEAILGANTPSTSTKKIETCTTCHGAGKSQATAAVHAVAAEARATASDVTVSGSDLKVTVTATVGGQPSNAFAYNAGWRVYRHQYNATLATPTVIAAYERVTLTKDAATNGYTVAALGNGQYEFTFTGAATLPTAQKFLVSMTDSATASATQLVATAVKDFGNARDLVGDQSCVNCHGSQVFRHREANGEWHHGANPYGVSACVVCHTRSTSTSRSAGGDRLTSYVHGVHNSHEMPARSITSNVTVGGVPTPFTVAKPDGVYARNDSLRLVTGSTTQAEISSPWSIGFPGYMVNCSACHDTQARLDAVMARPITFSTCMSCHDDWNGFPTFDTANAKYTAKVAANANWATIRADHVALPRPVAGTPTADTCGTCHNGTTAFATVGDVHNTRMTGRSGLVYDGRDQSIAQGERIAMTITGASINTAVTPNTVVVTWTATLDNTAVNPCNTTVSTTAPIFHAGGAASAAPAGTGQAASNMSLLLAWAQGDDWVNAGVGTSPGQPTSVNLSTTNTACSGNVATTTVPLPAGIPASVVKGGVGLQGKPQITFVGTNVNPGNANPNTRVIQVRSESPTFGFTLATGAPAPRREIVSNDKCLACHAGSLYQHGGNRIDSVQLCVMCHNPASNEKSVRAGMGVDASEAYDRKAGQTYDLRYMLHAIHSAGETDSLLVFYRTNGIYAFGSQAAIDLIPNWPGAGNFQPYGAFAAEPVRTHNEIVVHYPRALNACDACHVNGSENNFGDQASRMAVTVHDSGATQPVTGVAPLVYTGVENAVQTDDVLVGATSASCMSCHRSGVAATQAALQSHANTFGWTPAAFANGRQTLIDYVTLP